VETAYKASVRRISARAGMTAMVIVLAFGGITLLLWSGAHLVLAGEMTPGTLAQFALLAMMAAGSIGAWARSGAMSRRPRGHGADLRAAQFPPGIAAPEKPQTLPVPAQGAIAFKA
jgi:ATP-binding cassette subfamily B protein